MTGLHTTVPATLTKNGGVLIGVIRRTGKPKDAEPRAVPRREWDTALVDHVEAMADGDTVDVEVTFDLASGARTVRLAGVGALAAYPPDLDRVDAVGLGGFVNPYTFVPTLPRDGLEGTGLGDGPPPSHAHHTGGQWSGTLAVTLTTVTPLLLPVLAELPRDDQPKVYDVRVGPDGRPAIHGASFKGALRSAYETITASRYGVFFEHHDRLAYRVPAGAALDLTPARVCRNAAGTSHFRLCQGDATWKQTSRPRNEVQDAAWVPAYPGRHLQRLGGLRRGQLTDHHGRQVWARVVLYQYHRGDGKAGRATEFQVWRATHLAADRSEIDSALAKTPPSDPPSAGRLTLVAGTQIVRGWLSATGHSIKSKHDERLFIETPGLDVPLGTEHEQYWHSVLRAYDVAAGYNDPKATYRRDPATADGVERSLHVPSTEQSRTLPHGTLVYVKYDRRTKTISEVHPVMIGRLPFGAPPATLLPESLRPAQDRNLLSPADRLFGWVPPGRRDDGEDTNDGSSGYRGRLSVRSITCTTDDWQPDPPLPAGGITLAPLSSPKPTQFRFYAAPDQTGMPMDRQAAKADGYLPDGGLRGRKMYRWRQETPGHWQPPADREDPTRGYLAMDAQRGKPKQLGKHRGWVRPGVTFEVVLRLDGVPEAELGALLWLLTRGDTAPLRLGAGKPYGFGVVTAHIDQASTRLWDAGGIRGGWLRLTRPDPADAERLTALTDGFTANARANPVLLEATTSYLAAAKPVTEPVNYPRTTPEPQAESYQWFVANERPEGGRIVRGWALPHVRHPEQRLPYLDAASSDTGRPDRVPHRKPGAAGPNATGRGGGRGRRPR